jgi:hypothetical protein
MALPPFTLASAASSQGTGRTAAFAKPPAGLGSRAPASGLDRLGSTPKMLQSPPRSATAQTGPFTIARQASRPFSTRGFRQGRR